MLERLKDANKVVGTRRVLRSIEAGQVCEVFLARDAELFIVRQVRTACEEHQLKLTEADSMKELGRACGIEVGSACAAILKQ